MGSPLLFVVHAPEDAWFVEGFLLAALQLPPNAVLVSSNLELGAVLIEEIARGAVSPVTVVVVSPAFAASPWAQFANQLAMHSAVEAPGETVVIPAILADCALPLLSRCRVSLDFRIRNRDHWEAEAGRLRNRLAAQAPSAVTLDCPYPGIRPFATSDAAHFYGRKPEISNLLGQLRDGIRELYVIGPSGSGKSSVVAAGLLPALHSTPELAGGRGFVVVQLRPGADPVGSLAEAVGTGVDALLANRPNCDRLLIFIDQLEELFTLAHAGARTVFAAALRALRADPRVHFVLTLRADFYSALIESPLWDDLDGQLPRLDIGPLRGDKLRLAIEAPARALGVHFEPVLVERLLHDAADEPGALPLLQDALFDLWHHRTRGLLRLTEYEAMGDGARSGLAVSVARRATSALSELPVRRRQIARIVLLRLIQFGDGSADTRRRQPRAALATVGDASGEVDAVLRHLVDRRLVTVSGDGASAQIDLAHEVLLSAWPALAEWVASRKQDELYRRALEAKAAEWVSAGRGKSRLLDADELREVRAWRERDDARDLGLSDHAYALIAHSDAELSAQRAEVLANQRWRRRAVKLVFAGLTVAVLTVSGLGLLALRRSKEADERTVDAQRALASNRIAQARSLLLGGEPARAAPYLLAGREGGAKDDDLRMLFRWALRGLPVDKQRHGAAILSVAWSHSPLAAIKSDDRAEIDLFAWSLGRSMIATTRDHVVRLWSVATGTPGTQLVHNTAVTAIAWSPDGQRFAVGCADGALRIWDANGNTSLDLPVAHHDRIAALAWSPNGQLIATASTDGSARLWNASTGRSAAPPLPHPGKLVAVAWSPDGHLATASEDGTTQLWGEPVGRRTGPVVLVHPGKVVALAWSPNSQRIATATDDRTAQLWDAHTGRSLTLLIGHQDVVQSVVWSPDGQRITTLGQDSTALVWDTDSGQPITPPFLHQGSVASAAWSPDGQQLVTASDDRITRVWNTSDALLVPPLVHAEVVRKIAWSHRGELLATATERTVQVWDGATGQSMIPPFANGERITALVWNYDASRLATATADGRVQIWNARTGQSMTPPLVHPSPVDELEWNSGNYLITSCVEQGLRSVRTWNMDTGQLMDSATSAILAIAASQSPDDHIITSGPLQGGVIPGPRCAARFMVNGRPIPGPCPPRSRNAASLFDNPWAPPKASPADPPVDEAPQVWDLTAEQPIGPIGHPPYHPTRRGPPGTMLEALVQRSRDPSLPFRFAANPFDHQPGIRVLALSPDKRWTAIASSDGTVRVWSAQTAQPVTPPMYHGGVTALAWSPDTRRLASAGADRTVRIWDVGEDNGTLDEWRAIVERGDYYIGPSGDLMLRESEASSTLERPYMNSVTRSDAAGSAP